MTNERFNEIRAYLREAIRINSLNFSHAEFQPEVTASIDLVVELVDEIKRLREIEWMYKDLCK